MKLNKFLVPIIMILMTQPTVVVAEPSLGSFGSDAIAQTSAFIAQPSLDRFTGRTIRVQVSAYNALESQTDSRPWETADGSDLRLPSKRNTVATNDLPLGTRVMFPDLDPGIEYVVRDRMNERYTGKGIVDIFMGTDVTMARAFGRHDNIAMIVLY